MTGPVARRIAYQPFHAVNRDNAYSFRVREALAAFGEVVGFEGTAATLLKILRGRTRRLDALVLNWTDNDLLDRRTRTVAARKIAKLFVRTLAMRLVARRMVFVRHNNHPHATARSDHDRARRWVDRYERLFDVVLTHSGEAEQAPRLYCPHPLYHRVEVDDAHPALASLPPDYCVIFGRIVPYKHIEELMDAFPPDRQLVVIGAVGNAAYAERLAAKRLPQVRFMPGFLPEAAAQAIVSHSAALLIAHADADVVVSSSFFYAMSMKVPVIALATPFLRWIAPRVGSEVLTVVDDLDALCAAVRTHRRSEVSAETAAIIEDQFGNRRVHDALATALGFPKA